MNKSIRSLKPGSTSTMNVLFFLISMAVADIACINMEYKCITSEKEKTADVYFCIRALILVVCVCIYFFALR